MIVTHLITTVERGGAEVQLLTLTKQQVQDGIEVVVLSLKGKQELRHQFEKIGVSCMAITDISRVTRIVKSLKKSDLIHAHLPRAEIVAFLIYVLTRKAFVVTRHNTEKFFPKFPDSLSKLISRLILKRAKAIIAISFSVREYLIKSKEITQISQLFVIHYGYSRYWQEIQLKKQSRLERRKKIITISRLEPQKNLLYTLSVLKNSLESKEYSFAIIGNGSLRNKLEAYAQNLGIESHVKFLGKISNVFEELIASDVFLLLSKYEGFGLSLLEAMDSGCRILASDLPVIREVLGDDYKFFVDINQESSLAVPLEKLMAESDRYFRSTYEARLELFSAEKCSASHLDLYSTVLRNE